MGYCAGGFALLAADTTLRVYKDSFHASIPFSKPCKKNGISNDSSQNTSSLKTYPPIIQTKNRHAVFLLKAAMPGIQCEQFCSFIV
jgi:hypothetical protein